MIGQNSNSRLILLVALVIGVIGTVGQSYLLHHELVDCYPFKIMSFPPPSFYRSIADTGVYFAPFVAIIIGLLFGLKRFWLALIVPVILCPLTFAGIFKIALLVREWSGIVDAGRNFDGTTPEMVAQGFYSYAVSLAVAGLIIGGICSFLLLRLAKIGKPILQ